MNQNKSQINTVQHKPMQNERVVSQNNYMKIFHNTEDAREKIKSTQVNRDQQTQQSHYFAVNQQIKNVPRNQQASSM